jgi:hypothetical protein
MQEVNTYWFYKISIKSITTGITHSYIGSTNNYKSRIGQHKHNIKTKRPYGLYEVINNNGGLSNVIFDIIEVMLCTNKKDILQREQQLIILHNCDLNLNRPISCPIFNKERIKSRVICPTCNKLYTYTHANQHNKTKIHISFKS